MIDFIKLRGSIPDYHRFASMYADHEHVHVHTQTGEILSPRLFDLGQIKVRIWQKEEGLPAIVEVSGSLHKSFEGGTNYKDFTFSDLKSEVDRLSSTLELDFEALKIVNLEFGVNIQLDEPPFEMLENNLLLYRTLPFLKMEKGKGNVCIGFKSEQINPLKVYDKSKQYYLSNQILRVEKRYKRSVSLRQIGIVTIYDLLDKNKLSKLGDELRKAWEHVLLYDSNLLERLGFLPPKRRDFYKASENPKYWARLAKSKMTFFRKKKVLRALIKKYGNDRHSAVMALLKAKLLECLE